MPHVSPVEAASPDAATARTVDSDHVIDRSAAGRTRAPRLSLAARRGRRRRRRRRARRPQPRPPARAGAPRPAAGAGTGPPPGMPIPTDYVIGPDDVLGIVFWRDADMTRRRHGAARRHITLPLLQRHQGRRPEARRAARGRSPKAAGKFIEDPNVTVVVRQINSRNVFITGQVSRPGAVPGLGPDDRAAADRGRRRPDRVRRRQERSRSCAPRTARQQPFDSTTTTCPKGRSSNRTSCSSPATRSWSVRRVRMPKRRLSFSPSPSLAIAQSPAAAQVITARSAPFAACSAAAGRPIRRAAPGAELTFNALGGLRRQRRRRRRREHPDRDADRRQQHRHVRRSTSVTCMAASTGRCRSMPAPA